MQIKPYTQVELKIYVILSMQQGSFSETPVSFEVQFFMW